MPASNRRQFLQLAAAGLASAPAAMAANTSSSNRPAEPGKKYDVIVIGGGFAGVTAARDATAAGLDALLLEAKGLLGGRTFTSEHEGHLIEYGGTWIHWNQPHVWSEVMRYKLEIKETSGANPDAFMFRENDRIVKQSVEEAWPDLDAAVSKTCSRAPELYPRPYEPLFNSEAWKKVDHMTLDEGIEQAGLTERQAMFARGGILATTTSNLASVGGYTDVMRVFSLSGNSSALYLDCVGRYKIKKGTSALIRAMSADERIAIQLGTPVLSIEQGRSGVKITDDRNRTYQAEHCIVAVPLNVLKKIKFEPGLSALKLAASKEEHSGKGVKFYAVVKGDLGDVMGIDGGNVPIHLVMTYARNSRHTVLVGFGPGKQFMNPGNRSEVERAISRLIGKVEIESVLSYDWTLDPYSLGTWNYYKPMQATKYWRALQENEGRIHFANSDNASGWRGFIDGAIERGKSVAHDIVQLQARA